MVVVETAKQREPDRADGDSSVTDFACLAV